MNNSDRRRPPSTGGGMGEANRAACGNSHYKK